MWQVRQSSEFDVAPPEEALAGVAGVVDRVAGGALELGVAGAVEMVADGVGSGEADGIGAGDLGVDRLDVVVVEADRVVVLQVVVRADAVGGADGRAAAALRGGRLVGVAVGVDRDAAVMAAHAEQRDAAHRHAVLDRLRGLGAGGRGAGAVPVHVVDEVAGELVVPQRQVVVGVGRLRSGAARGAEVGGAQAIGVVRRVAEDADAVGG